MKQSTKQSTNKPYSIVELQEFYENAGYMGDLTEDLIQVNGYRFNSGKNQHEYLFAYYDSSEEEYFIAQLDVHLGLSGKIIAGFTGVPVIQGVETKEEIIQQLNEM